MRLLKIDIESDVRVPGQGNPDVRNEISVIETDEGYELETVYSIDASEYRDRNTNEFYSDVIELGSKEKIDKEYFEPLNDIQLSKKLFKQKDISIEYFPGMEKSHQSTYNLETSNPPCMSPFLTDLLDLNEERVFADAINESIDKLPVHEENQDPVSAEEFKHWINQIPRQSYQALVESMDEINDVFSEQVAGRQRDFEDSLKSTFSQVSEELAEKGNYDETPSPQELYELFTDVRGLEPVSSQNISNQEYSTFFGQNMERFVLNKRKEIAFEHEDIERMRPNEDIQNPNAYKVDSSSKNRDEDSSNNFLENNDFRLIEGVFTVEDGGNLEDFLRWEVDE